MKKNFDGSGSKRLSDKCGPGRTASVCRKAKEYGILELILSDKVKRRHAGDSEKRQRLYRPK